MENTINVSTVHSLRRAKERCGIKNHHTAKRNIDMALIRGRKAEDCTSWERSYLEQECCGNCTAIAYNNFCYIVNEYGVCVTVYALPQWFGKKKHFDGKERIRNYKKYWRCNADCIDRVEMS